MKHCIDTYRYCPQCGGSLASKTVKENEPDRLVCNDCGFIFYLDPKVAACAIIEIDGKIVMLKRAISPGRGKWVIPGGFVDLGEPVPQAAVREVWEEVRLDVVVDRLVGVYSYPQRPVVVIVYSARVQGGELQAADETLAVSLFDENEIPWHQIAFTSTTEALETYLQQRRRR